MTRDEVSVVIPSRNREVSVRELVASLISQVGDRIAMEIIVIDDCSPQPYDLSDLPVRSLRNPTRRGAPASRNRGIDEASRQFLLMLDDDLRISSPRFVETGIDLLRARPDLACVLPRVIHHSGGRARDLSVFQTRLVDGFLLPKAASRGEVEYGCMAYLARVEWLRAIGGYDSNFGGSSGHSYREETDLQVRLRRSGGRLWFEPSMVLQHLTETGGGQEKAADYYRFWTARNHILYLRKNDRLWVPRIFGHLAYHIVGGGLIKGGIRIGMRGWLQGLRRLPDRESGQTRDGEGDEKFGPNPPIDD